MDDAEKLLRNWRQNLPRDGAKCEDALKVIRFLDMTLKPTPNSQGHYQASHDALKGSVRFPFGSITMSCHAFGVTGKAHPKAIQDILQAAKIIQAAQQKKRQNDEDDTE